MVPNALRSNESTITIRVNEVSMIKMAGARERIVINRKICSTTAVFPESLASSMPMVIKGAEDSGAAAALLWGANRTAPRPIPKIATRSKTACAHAMRLSLR